MEAGSRKPLRLPDVERFQWFERFERFEGFVRFERCAEPRRTSEPLEPLRTSRTRERLGPQNLYQLSFAERDRGGSRSTLGYAAANCPTVSRLRRASRREHLPDLCVGDVCLPHALGARGGAAHPPTAACPREGAREGRGSPGRRAGCDVGLPESRLSRRAAGSWRPAVPRPNQNHHGGKPRVLNRRSRRCGTSAWRQ